MDSLRKLPPPKPLPPKTFLVATAPPVVFSPPQAPVFARKPAPQKKHGGMASALFLFFGVVLFLCLSSLGFLLYKGFSVSQSIQFENKENTSFVAQLKGLTHTFLSDKRKLLTGEERGRVNILLLGRAGETYPGKNLTDTVMVMSIDTESKKVALLSLPRDLYVPIANTALYTKLNSLYQYGLNSGEDVAPVKETLEDITGETIHYFITVDFDSFEKVIDTLGGIQVDVVRDFYDTRYPGKNYSYETFEIKKGWQTLDGATALKYVRERHDDPEGDFGRAKRQQQVIQAIKDKAFSAGTFLNIFTINSLLDTFGENVKTDMTLEEMGSFIELSKALDTKNISSVVIDAWKKESLLRVSHVLVGSINAFILVPRVGNWSEIQDVSKNVFDLDALKERKEKISVEAPRVTILHTAEDTPLMYKVRELLLEEMGCTEVTLKTYEPLEIPPEKSMIVDRVNLSKPFSLDELLKKFSLEKVLAHPFKLPPTDTSDYVLIVGNDFSVNLLEEDGTLEKSLSDEATFSEPLPPQPKPEKKKK